MLQVLSDRSIFGAERMRLPEDSSSQEAIMGMASLAKDSLHKHPLYRDHLPYILTSEFGHEPCSEWANHISDRRLERLIRSKTRDDDHFR